MPAILFITDEAPPAIVDAVDAFVASGHQSTLVAHGLDALEVLASSRFDAICVHVRVPERDGVALAWIVRDCPAYLHVPIIALVGTVTCDEQMAMTAAGIDLVFPTPATAAPIDRAIRQRLEAPERVPSLLEAFASYRDQRAARPRGAWTAYATT